MSQGSLLQDNKESSPKPSPEPDSHKDEANTNTTATVTADVAPPAPTRNCPSCACNIRTAARLYSASQSVKPKAAKREPRHEDLPQHCGGVSLSRCKTRNGRELHQVRNRTHLMHHQGELNTQSWNRIHQR